MNSRKRKLTEENREFNKAWTEKFAFIEVNGNPSCLICHLRLQNNKSSNVERHFQRKHLDFSTKYPEGDSRKKAVDDLQRKTLIQQRNLSTWTKSSSTITEASFLLSLEIAKAGKPFTDGEFLKNCMYNVSEILFQDMTNKDEICRKIQDLPLSARTVKERILTMSTEVSNMQIMDINSSEFISIAVDESTDISDMAQCCVMAKYITSSGIREELLDLVTLKGHTTGQDISESILTCLKNKHVNLNSIVCIATDGAPSMIGNNKGFLKLFSTHIPHQVISFHCILHQEALIAKSIGLLPQLKEIMDVVMPMINFIRAKALNHRLFHALLEEVGNERKDLVNFTAVRWLSRGKALKRFYECLNEVIIFLTSKNYNEQHVQFLSHPDWIQHFCYLLDMTEHFNTLNLKLQGKGNTALQLLEEVLIFEQKLNILLEDVAEGKFIYFKNLKNYRLNIKNEKRIDCKIFAEMITVIKNSFTNRFQDFKKHHELMKFILHPLNCKLNLIDISAFPGISIADLKMELLEIQNKCIWVQKLQQMVAQIEENESCMKEAPQEIIFKCWNSFPNNYINAKRLAFGILTFFGSTYNCEQLFSSMNYMKNKYRGKMTDESLKAELLIKCTAYTPDLSKLANNLQNQKSH